MTTNRSLSVCGLIREKMADWIPLGLSLFQSDCHTNDTSCGTCRLASCSTFQSLISRRCIGRPLRCVCCSLHTRCCTASQILKNNHIKSASYCSMRYCNVWVVVWQKLNIKRKFLKRLAKWINEKLRICTYTALHSTSKRQSTHQQVVMLSFSNKQLNTVSNDTM